MGYNEYLDFGSEDEIDAGALGGSGDMMQQWPEASPEGSLASVPRQGHVVPVETLRRWFSAADAAIAEIRSTEENPS